MLSLDKLEMLIGYLLIGKTVCLNSGNIVKITSYSRFTNTLGGLCNGHNINFCPNDIYELTTNTTTHLDIIDSNNV